MIFQFFSFLLHTVFSAGIIGNFFFSFLPSFLFFGFRIIVSLLKKLTCMVNLEVFKQKACFQNRWISRALWFVSTSRNASVLIFSCLAAYLLEINGMNQLTLSGIKNTPSKNGVYFYFTKKKLGERMRPSKRETALHGTIGIFAVDVVG